MRAAVRQGYWEGCGGYGERKGSDEKDGKTTKPLNGRGDRKAKDIKKIK